MANVNTGQQQAGMMPGAGAFGDLKVLIGEHTYTVAASSSDTLTFFTAPKGFTPLFGWLVGDDIDTGTEALEIDIGISGDTTKYLDSGVITGDTAANEKITVGIKIPLQEELMTEPMAAFTADTPIIATITAAANAGGTGTLRLIMCGVYNDARVGL